MPNLLELAQQGDPGTIDDSKLGGLKLLAPRELYFLWERQQWQSQAIDFTQDQRDWAQLDDEQRGFLVWNLASFFVGEERVTTAFSPIVMSADDEHEESFLATQQVDEARHMQFFDRFWTEVFDDQSDTLRERLIGVRKDCNEAFIELFDHRLMESVERLRVNSRDREAKIEAITIYHMIVEGTLALTGQHYLTDYMTREQIFPGFVEGFNKVARDEHRHVAYGTWFLQEACRDDEDATRIVHDTLLELLPVAAKVLVPKGMEGQDEYMTPAGYHSSEINMFAFTALSRRLKVAGIGLPVAA
jgi:ribonucleoside-diphosphate reductase beta chain